MKIVYALLLLLPLAGSCQTRPLRQKQPAEASSPMNCEIEGKVLRILPPKKEEQGICARYSCTARVQVIAVSSCGASVSAMPAAGDTITVQFAYTVHATKKLFPKMTVHYPGLRSGNIFTANASQRLAIGAESFFVVYGYTRR